MKRRTVFKHLAVASAAAWLLPSCVSDTKKVSVALNRLQISADEETLLGALADVMIPSTPAAGSSAKASPGARDVGAHLFALVMVDDCLPKDQQQKYLEGMRRFDRTMKSITGKTFSGAEPSEQLAMLRAFEGKLEEVDEAVRVFYSRTRGYIIQGYTSSQYFLTEVKPYSLVPGPNYEGCAPVSENIKPIS